MPPPPDPGSPRPCPPGPPTPRSPDFAWREEMRKDEDQQNHFLKERAADHMKQSWFRKMAQWRDATVRSVRGLGPPWGGRGGPATCCASCGPPRPARHSTPGIPNACFDNAPCAPSPLPLYTSGGWRPPI